MRVPPSLIDETSDDPVVKAMVLRRGGKLLDLDRVLLHSPPFAGGWNTLIAAVRTGLTLPPRLGALAMYAISVLHGSQYEQGVHGPAYMQAGGSTAGLMAADALAVRGVPPGLRADEAAVLALALAMTRDVDVDDATFAQVKAVFPDAQIVELVGVISAFNMVTRFILALKVFPS